MARTTRSAKRNATLRPFLTHLELLGYKVERKKEVYFAGHERHLTLCIEEKFSGINVYTLFRTNEVAKLDKAGFLKTINDLNASAMVLRFYADGENDLIMDAWHPKTYRREGFGAFIDMLHAETLLCYDERFGLKAYCG